MNDAVPEPSRDRHGFPAGEAEDNAYVSGVEPPDACASDAGYVRNKTQAHDTLGDLDSVSQTTPASLESTAYSQNFDYSGFASPRDVSPLTALDIPESGVVEYRIQGAWHWMYALLSKYKDREGNCHVPSNHKEGEENLGTWLKTQRQRKRKGNLDPLRIQLLEDIGVAWDPLAQKWEDMFSLLERYKRREGHCKIPRSYNEDKQRLRQWLNDQRQLKKKGTLSPSKQERLEKLGVVWNPLAQQWEDMFSLLERYEQREGHCRVPKSYKEDNKRLGQWLYDQRQLKKKGSLDPSKEERLDKLGVVWNPSSRQWEDMFSLLERYKQGEGHCNVPQKYKGDGKLLGQWLDRQRQLKKQGNLDPSKDERLEKLGVVWNPLSQKWEDMFYLLERYKQRKGHCNVPRSYNQDKQALGIWLNDQRQLKKKGDLDPSKEERMERLGVVWNVQFQQWEEMFSLLEIYIERKGICILPQKYEEEEKPLGVWLNYQCHLKKKGKLDPERLRRLEELGIVWRLK